MCAAQTNPPSSFNYTWGFADNSRTESVVEISPNINYTVTDASVSGFRGDLFCLFLAEFFSPLTPHKDAQFAIERGVRDHSELSGYSMSACVIPFPAQIHPPVEIIWFHCTNVRLSAIVVRTYRATGINMLLLLQHTLVLSTPSDVRVAFQHYHSTHKIPHTDTHTLCVTHTDHLVHHTAANHCTTRHIRRRDGFALPATAKPNPQQVLLGTGSL